MGSQVVFLPCAEAKVGINRVTLVFLVLRDFLLPRWDFG